LGNRYLPGNRYSQFVPVKQKPLTLSLAKHKKEVNKKRANDGISIRRSEKKREGNNQ
jgi:hypothetical protein